MKWLLLLVTSCSANEESRTDARPPQVRRIEQPAPVLPDRRAPPEPTTASPTTSSPEPVSAGPLAVSIENREPGTPPDASSAEAGARRLLDAIKADDPAPVRDFFFPAEAFDLVKDMAVPGRYHRRLVAWYDEDVHAMHDDYRDVGEAVFERFEMGRCRWMDVHTEGNKLPYWSCRRSRIHARAGERPRVFEIHVLINWGRSWYVTHLGPIRN